MTTKRFIQLMYGIALSAILLFIEVYLWCEFHDVLTGWFLELVPIWIGGLLGINGTIFVLRRFRMIRSRKLSVIGYTQIISGLFRFIELIMVLTHLKDFWNLIIQKELPLVGWSLFILGVTILLCHLPGVQKIMLSKNKRFRTFRRTSTST